MKIKDLFAPLVEQTRGAAAARRTERQTQQAEQVAGGLLPLSEIVAARDLSDVTELASSCVVSWVGSHRVTRGFQSQVFVTPEVARLFRDDETMAKALSVLHARGEGCGAFDAPARHCVAYPEVEGFVTGCSERLRLSMAPVAGRMAAVVTLATEADPLAAWIEYARTLARGGVR